jgi:hypothetical protein
VDPERQKLIANPEHGGIQMTAEFTDHSTLNSQPSTLRSIPNRAHEDKQMSEEY